MVGVESDVERVVQGEDGPLHGGAVSEAVDVGVEGYGAALAVPGRAHHGIAHHGLVVADVFHVESGGLEQGRGGIEPRGVEGAGGVPSKHHFVDAERLEKVVEREIGQVECEAFFGVGRHYAVDSHVLSTVVYVDACHVHLFPGYGNQRRIDGPGGVVECQFAGQQVDAGFGREASCGAAECGPCVYIAFVSPRAVYAPVDLSGHCVFRAVAFERESHGAVFGRRLRCQAEGRKGGPLGHREVEAGVFDEF